MAKQITWISEREAAGRLGYRRLRTLRDKVKSGELNVTFTTRPDGKIFRYDSAAIEKILHQNARISA